MDPYRRRLLHRLYLQSILGQHKAHGSTNTCLKIYQVDAFAAKVFEGNPTAVIPLTGPDWPEDTEILAIARRTT